MSGRAVRALALVAVCSALVPSGTVPAAADVGSAPVAHADGARPPQLITAPTPTAEDYFGTDVAIDGDTLLVGAYEWSSGYDRPGHAYVYTRQPDGTWAHQATLEATDAAGGAWFGSAVAIEGDTAVIGSHGHQKGVIGNVGAVYVYTRSGTTWTPRTRMEPTSTQVGYFGQDVAISGDTIAVGEMPISTPETFFPGAVSVFRGSGASWSFEDRVFAPDQQRDSCFGQAVAIEGDTVVVGARQQRTWTDGWATTHGAAYVYTRSGAVWSLQQQLFDPTYPAYAGAGTSVDIEGDQAYIGVPEYSGTRGHVSVYSRSGTVWSHEATLADPDPWSDGQTNAIGRGVAADGGLVLAGDDYDYSPTTTYSGAVHSFVASGTEWLHFGKSRSVPPSESAGMGEHIALSGGYGAAGWIGYSLGEYTYEGAALVWDCLPPLRTSEEVTLTLPAPGVLRNDTDADGDPLTASVVTTPTHGALTLDADGSFVYVPEKDFFGEDSFTYRAYDGSQYSAAVTCTIAVANVNDAPVAIEDTYTVVSDGSLTIDAPGVLANDVDVDGDSPWVAANSDPSHGTVSIDSDGSFTYEPTAGYTGQDAFYYVPYDGHTYAAEWATVTIEVTGTPPAKTFSQIAGQSRYDTAIDVSRSTYPTGACDAVILATGRNYPDALGAGSLAGVRDCPIVLVDGKGTSLPTTVRNEIQRLTQGQGSYDVYLMGGTLAISQAVENSLKAQLTGETVIRVAGVSRYDTAIDCATRVRDAAGTPRTDAFLCTGRDFADALLAGPVAFGDGRPILLTDNTTAVTDKLKTALDYMGTTDVDVVGSTTSVTEATRIAIDAHVSGACTRIAGATDCYQQSVDVADWATGAGLLDWNAIGVATGQQYPDALGASSYLGTNGSPILLTHKLTLDTCVRDCVAVHKSDIWHVTYFGGTLAIDQAVRDAVAAALE